MTAGARFAAASAAGLAALVAAHPAFAQRLGQAAQTEIPWWRVVGAFVICIGLALGAALALRTRIRAGAPLPAAFRFAPGRLRLFGPVERRLVVIEAVRGGQNLEICLVRCDEREFLLAATQGSIEVLSDSGRPAKPARTK